MSDLYTRDNGTYSQWSSGSAAFFPGHELTNRRLPVVVECRVGDLESKDMALLDTGAEWSVIGGDLAEIIQDQLGSPTGSISIDTRLGKYDGNLHRLSISLLAEENGGADLEVDATVLIAPEWPGPLVLGFFGFLERLKFAIDSGTVEQGEEKIYFGQTN